MGCYNPLLAEQRRRKREELLEATEQSLEKIAKEIARRIQTPLSEATIGSKVGRVLGRFKMGKHFKIKTSKGGLNYHRNEGSIETEQASIRYGYSHAWGSRPRVARSRKG